MGSRNCLKPWFARAELCLLAGLLIVAGLLPRNAASRDNPGLAGPESTAEARRIGMALPRSTGSDPAPIVMGITPASGANNGALQITDLSGSYFQPGATVKLTKVSQPDVSGSGVSVVSSSTITCTFDLTGVVTGTWDVVVTNPDDESGVLTEGFTVRSPSHVYFPLVMRNWPRIVSLDLDSDADATVLQALPDINTGSYKDVWIGYSVCPDTLPGITRGLLRFDTSVVPLGAPVVQATLHLHLVDSCYLGSLTHQVTAYRTTAPWEELLVTWNNKPGFAEAYGSVSILSATLGWYSLDVTGLVRGWVNGSTTNHGLTLRGPESSGTDTAWLGFAALEWPGVTYDPYLEVKYADYSTAASESRVPATVPVPEVAPSGSTIRELLSPLRADSEPSAPGIFESTEGRTSD